MALKRRDTKENRDYWDFVERTAAEVARWPAWKRGETSMRSRRRIVQCEHCHGTGTVLVDAEGSDGRS